MFKRKNQNGLLAKWQLRQCLETRYINNEYLNKAFFYRNEKLYALHNQVKPYIDEAVFASKITVKMCFKNHVCYM